MAKCRCGCAPLMHLLFFAFVLSGGCVGLSVYALYYDILWNLRIEEERHTLTEQTVEILLRDSVHEKVFVGIAGFNFLGTIVYMFVFCCCTNSLHSLLYLDTSIYFFAGATLMISSYFYVIPLSEYNYNYKKLHRADIHEESDYYFCDITNFKAYLNLTPTQKQILEEEKVCQHWEYKIIASLLAIAIAFIYATMILMECVLHKRKIIEDEKIKADAMAWQEYLKNVKTTEAKLIKRKKRKKRKQMKDNVEEIQQNEPVNEAESEASTAVDTEQN